MSRSLFIKNILVIVVLFSTSPILFSGENGTSLFCAVHCGDVVAVEKLLNAGANPEIRDFQRRTPLLIACFSGDLEIANKLVDHKADVNSGDIYGITPVLAATLKGKVGIVCLLIKHKCGLDGIGIVKRGIDVLETTQTFVLKYRRPLERTALMAACENQNSKIVQLLLDAGADPNVSNYSGETAIWFASMVNNYDLVKLLIQHGADPNKLKRNDKSLLPYLVSNKWYKICELLLSHGADVHINNEAPIMRYTWASHMDERMLELLLRHGADPNAHQGALLRKACSEKDVPAIKLLLKYGADPRIKKPGEKTALEIATELGNGEILALLQKRGGF